MPLRHTKLHRPPVTSDHLHRPRLLNKLAQRSGKVLTLVSAPAGYGKSTLLSNWMAVCKTPNAWVSLDENDTDLRSFLTLFTTAVESLFQGALPECRAMLNGVALPHITDLAPTVVNELEYIETPFILVLDDYHRIQNSDVHQLIAALLNAPGAPLHLALATRRDPPLPLALYRAKGRLSEIRANDLRFSRAETAAFIKKSLGRSIAAEAAKELEDKTEGWAVALRLATLAMGQDPDLSRAMARLPAESQYVADYIVAEIVLRQPPEIQEYLLRTAVLNRFCAPLCDALCVPGVLPNTCEMNGAEFIRQLVDANLFIVALDRDNRWYRFHHLFQQLLRRRLAQRFSAEQRKAIHQHAARWFAENGYLEEAFNHHLKAGRPEQAGQLAADHRHDLMNQESWPRLDGWMASLPLEVVENNIELLLTKAWLFENRLRLPEMNAVLNRVEALRQSIGKSNPVFEATTGEYLALRAAASYLAGDGPATVALARKGCRSIPPAHSSELAFALIVLAFGLQMTGKAAQGRHVIMKALDQADAHARTYHARLLFGLCFLDWLEADIQGILPTADQVLQFGRHNNLLESVSFGHYFMGLARYHGNDLEGAEAHLRAAVERGKQSNINTFAHASYLLALTYQGLGRPDTARQSAETVTSHALATHNGSLLQESKAFAAELALIQGNLPAAVHWAETYIPLPLAPLLRYYLPQLTLIKVRLAQETPEGVQQAAEWTSRLIEYYTAIGNRRLLAEVLLLEAQRCHFQNQTEAAHKAMLGAVVLAQPGEFQRPFIEMGAHIPALMDRLMAEDPTNRFLKGIREAIGTTHPVTREIRGPSTPPSPAPSIVHQELTNREFEILQLLAQRLRDKEIASELFISPATVKRHTANIYRKLKVRGRQQAVMQGRELGLL